MIADTKAASASADPRRPNGISSIYEDKPASYFSNARLDFVERLPTGPDSAVLELGCGSGGTGKAVLAAGKAGRYVGIELNAAAAASAAEVLTEVLVGNVEEMDLDARRASFDALLVSEVLEHLTDPWTTLRRLAQCVRPGGLVLASSPNVAHWRVVLNLFLGRFRYQQSGLMDRTHLRWFTPESFRNLFEEAGIEVVSLQPIAEPGWKGKVVNLLTGNRLSHLFVGQIVVTGKKS
jgi:2-polyprenyl-3-methyl-5-hydroxy-6-metoxy-1,4-benzoquinol methylase